MFCSVRFFSSFTTPWHEDDYYRYLWDGKVLAAGLNPLAIAPQEVLNNEPAKKQDTPETSSADLVENSQSNPNKPTPESLNSPLKARQLAISSRRSLLPEKERDLILSNINYPTSPSIYGPDLPAFFVDTKCMLRGHRERVYL